MLTMTVAVARWSLRSCRSIVADCDVKERPTSPSAMLSIRCFADIVIYDMLLCWTDRQTRVVSE